MFFYSIQKKYFKINFLKKNFFLFLQTKNFKCNKYFLSQNSEKIFYLKILFSKKFLNRLFNVICLCQKFLKFNWYYYDFKVINIYKNYIRNVNIYYLYFYKKLFVYQKRQFYLYNIFLYKINLKMFYLFIFFKFLWYKTSYVTYLMRKKFYQKKIFFFFYSFLKKRNHLI